MALPCARAEKAEDTSALFSAWQESSSSSATRSPKPLSLTAENTTIITQKEIESLNAHTLADVLATIPGIQTQNYGAAGGLTSASIQSARNYHALVMVDGIPLNNLSENFSDVAMVPARIIERIEVVKGAASSAWGQALGGVINVITKTPDQRKIGGVATSSYGEGATADSSIELSGTVDRLGYYFSGGYLGFKNIPQHITTDSNNVYAKLTYDLSDQGQVWGTFSHSHGNRTNLYIPRSDWDLREEQKTTYIYASLGMRRKLSDSLELEISGRHAYRNFDTVDTNISDGLPWSWSSQPRLLTKERVYGASAKLIWRESNNLLVVGGDFEHVKLSANGTYDYPLTPVSRSEDRWGFFLNDTYTIGDLAVTVGARFDRPKTTSDQFSPSLGVTYKLSETTLLRGYTARGYSLWALTFDDTPAEKVWTSQIGIETTAVPYLWQKLTLFRNQMWSFTTWNDSAGIYESDRRMALGVEYEIRTTPVFNTSIGAGYTFTDTELSKNHDYESGVPRHTVQVSLRYDDKTFRGVLTGRHIFWNTQPSSEPLYNGDYGGMIWDLHLGATLVKREERSLEVFFSGRNLFDGSQTPSNYCVYPGRWFEGGVRVRF
ncbi:TonB-dependent receptor plug domain-containing protein [Pelobacter propionicus]|uniref:TonB-dependent receptor plug domain-containing protein n=1 Tax=Pelobacter propionicus TaxID=29543 RepID=UPI0002E35D6F|nr:TonB-dependent receptor [Pelobacter propionicus]